MTILTLPSTGLNNRPTSSEFPTILDPDLDDALCPQTDAAAFFRGSNATDHEWLSTLRVCAECPVPEKCLDAALEVPEDDDWGVWGGTTRPERKKIRKNPELRAKYAQRLIDIRSNHVSVTSLRASRKTRKVALAS